MTSNERPGGSDGLIDETEGSSDPATPATITTTYVGDPRKERKRSRYRDIIETLLLAVLIFVAVRMVVVNYRVVGQSMLPGLEGGEMLLVNRNAYASFDTWALVDWLPGVEHEEANIVHPFSPPQRGDIVVLNAPVEGSSSPYIKRIIGLEGETVEIRDEVVLIDGQPLNEPYLDDETTMCRAQPDCGPFLVPEGSVFVLGDNRDNSSDSPDFGPVEIDDIIGKAWFGYWPLNKIGVVPHYDYPEISDEVATPEHSPSS